jgi:hypothetical protein
MKEEQLREDQRREALARSKEEPGTEETLPPARVETPVEAPTPVMHAEPVTAEPARSEPVRSEPVRSEEPIRAEPKREPQQPRIDPKALLESAGLVMIETDRSKAPAPAPTEEPQQHLGRPRRERPKPPSQDDDLQQVETKH